MGRLGVHVSIAGGLSKAFERAKRLSCETFQIFSRSPRSWAFKHKSNEISRFRELKSKGNISPVALHSAYLVNLASPDPSLRKKSVDAVKEDLSLAKSIGAEFVVVHPGSGVVSREEGRKNLLKSLEEIVKSLDRPWLLLENTAGQGMHLGSSIKELVGILEELGLPQGIGICFDTCHAFASGLDIGDPRVLEEIINDLSRIGIRRLKLIHLNDTKTPFSSRVDIHQHICEGTIGLNRFRTFLSTEPFSNLPLILETPKKGDEDDIRNMGVVKSILEGST